MRDVEQLFEYSTGIDIGVIVSSLGLVYFGDIRRVGILSFLGGERIRSLLDETILDTLCNEVAASLCQFGCVVVILEVYLDLCTRGYEGRIRVRPGERSEDR